MSGLRLDWLELAPCRTGLRPPPGSGEVGSLRGLLSQWGADWPCPRPALAKAPALSTFACGPCTCLKEGSGCLPGPGQPSLPPKFLLFCINPAGWCLVSSVRFFSFFPSFFFFLSLFCSLFDVSSSPSEGRCLCSLSPPAGWVPAGLRNQVGLEPGRRRFSLGRV